MKQLQGMVEDQEDQEIKATSNWKGKYTRQCWYKPLK
jgi:hypothetical protein